MQIMKLTDLWKRMSGNRYSAKGSESSTPRRYLSSLWIFLGTLMKQKNNSTQIASTSTKNGVSTSNSAIPRPSNKELEVMRNERKETTPEQAVENTKAELKKYGVEPVHDITITDPFTGKQQIVSLDRTGTTEQKLIVALADPNLTRD